MPRRRPIASAACLIVARTLADYKESERMPAEITAALDNIHEDASSIKATKAEFDLANLQGRLRKVVAAFRRDLSDPASRICLHAINARRVGRAGPPKSSPQSICPSGP